MSETNGGSDRLDRIERALERIDSKYEARTTETANLLNRLTHSVVDLAYATESLGRSQQQLLTSQVLMQDRMERLDQRIEDLVSGIGAYIRKLDERDAR